MKNKKQIISFFSIWLIILSLNILADSCEPFCSSLPAATDTSSGISYPSSYNYQSDSVPSYIPPNPAIINGIRIKDYEGLKKEGDIVSVNKATTIEGTDFAFNNVENVKVSANENLEYAKLTSSEDNNVLEIENPLDTLKIEKIYIYLNKSLDITYEYENDSVKITFPEKSKIVVKKGSTNVTIESNNAQAELLITKEGIVNKEIVVEYPDFNIIAKTNNYGYDKNNKITLNGVIEYKRPQSFAQLKTFLGNYQTYLTVNLPFLTSYKSDKNNKATLSFNQENYTITNNYEDAEGNIFSVNHGFFKITLKSESPKKYYLNANQQNCPDFLKQISSLPETSYLEHPVEFKNDYLEFGNYRAYAENTKAFEKIENKIEQMIISNNPSKFRIISLR